MSLAFRTHSGYSRFPIEDRRFESGLRSVAWLRSDCMWLGLRPLRPGADKVGKRFRILYDSSGAMITFFDIFVTDVSCSRSGGCKACSGLIASADSRIGFGSSLRNATPGYPSTRALMADARTFWSARVPVAGPDENGRFESRCLFCSFLQSSNNVSMFPAFNAFSLLLICPPVKRDCGFQSTSCGSAKSQSHSPRLAFVNASCRVFPNWFHVLLFSVNLLTVASG